MLGDTVSTIGFVLERELVMAENFVMHLTDGCWELHKNQGVSVSDVAKGSRNEETNAYWVCKHGDLTLLLCQILVTKDLSTNFSNTALCSVGEDVSGMHTAFIIALMMEAVRTSETSVYLNKATRRYLPERCSYSPSWEPEISLFHF
jgi:hypothetical protein